MAEWSMCRRGVACDYPHCNPGVCGNVPAPVPAVPREETLTQEDVTAFVLSEMNAGTNNVLLQHSLPDLTWGLRRFVDFIHQRSGREDNHLNRTEK